MSDAKRPMTTKEIHEFFARFERLNPAPETELKFTNHFTLLIAVVLSAQATDKGVNKATESLFKVVHTPEDVLALGLDRLIPYIKTIGLYPSKAKNIMGLSEHLVADFGGQVPMDRAALESLPGVGRKTANVILNVAFGEETFAVDTHIFRVCNRTGLAQGQTPRAVEDGLAATVPTSFRKHAHHWLILHGRYTCIARKPKCDVCPVNDLCQFTKKMV
ncbi:MAG: endonuclease III [Alphaproteobacteria bacterium]|nr:endonuclease III [Alphaproteobacteria bacterium]OJV45130.1 MAG: endonuclease III [Alphaproteobacteria bacterium 43-37]